MVVGDPKTGKTSLIKIPTRKGSRHKHSSRINIHTWKYSPCTKAKAVTFKIWDFPSKVRIHILNYMNSQVFGEFLNTELLCN